MLVGEYNIAASFDKTFDVGVVGVSLQDFWGSIVVSNVRLVLLIVVLFLWSIRVVEVEYHSDVSTRSRVAMWEFLVKLFGFDSFHKDVLYQFT